ncbi:MAG: DUF596 domain-containing protein [Daejeonella sp.]
MINKEYLNEVYDNSLGHSLVSLWYIFKNETNFQLSKDNFLECLYVFIFENKLRLAKNGVFLKGSIQEQVKMFGNALPDEERMKEEESYWWYLDDCPGDAVWIVNEPIDGFTTPAENGKYYYWA